MCNFSSMSLLHQLASIISISEELKAELLSVSQPFSLTKGDFLLNKGDRCSNIYFVEKGLLRGYYFEEDKEITNWFAQDSEFATNLFSFITNKPSNEYIQALEDCELIKLSQETLQSLYVKFPETERLGRIITENYYIKLESRLLRIRFKTAKERYLKLCETNPSLLQRASLGQIASYLGITQETLSRIRAEV